MEGEGEMEAPGRNGAAVATDGGRGVADITAVLLEQR